MSTGERKRERERESIEFLTIVKKVLEKGSSFSSWLRMKVPPGGVRCNGNGKERMRKSSQEI